MEFIRGDTIKLKFLLKYKGNPVVKKEEIETLFLTVKKSIHSKEILIQKSLDDFEIDENGYVHVLIEPKDTEILNYAEYASDIEVTLKNGYRKTRLFNLCITGETTFHGGDLNEN